MKNLTAAGQIKVGYTVYCEYEDKPVKYLVKQVLNPGTDREEIIVNKKKNRYFITSMAINGTSWAKNVRIDVAVSTRAGMFTDLDPELKKKEFGWFAFDGRECPRCSLPLGPWHLNVGKQELFGCLICGYGVICNGSDQPDTDQAADRLAAILRTKK
jgi:hypothetical protein